MNFIFGALGEMLFILLLLVLVSIAVPVLISLFFKPKRKACECGEKLEPGMKFCPKCGRKVK